MANKRKRLRRFKCQFGIHRTYEAFGYPGVTVCEDCKRTWFEMALPLGPDTYQPLPSQPLGGGASQT